MKILIISPSWVGDMVMTQSLYLTLKEQYPESTIDALAPKWCLPILKKMPQINKAIEMPLGHGDLVKAEVFGRMGFESNNIV